MARSRKPTTVIDLGTDSIKFLSGTWSSDDRIALRKCLVHPFPVGAYGKYGLDIQIENLSQVLKEQRISDRVILGFTNPKRSLQTLSLPEMPKAELDEAIRFDLTEKKHFDPKKSLFDYLSVPITYDPSSVNRRIFATIHGREEIGRLTQVFAEHKVKLEAIENPDFALVNALARLGAFSTNKAYLVVNLGASSVQIIIVHDRTLVFERRLNTGGHMLTKSISTYCKLDLESAEKSKREYGISSDVMSDKIVEMINIATSTLEKLVSDIQYSLKHFSFQVTKAKITTFDKIILTGGLANLNGIRDFMQERLHFDCVVADFGEKIALPKSAPFTPGDNPWPLLNTALGLGFWNEEELNRRSTSLLPSSFSSRASSGSLWNSIWTGMGSAAVLLILFAALAIAGFLHLRFLDLRTANVKGKIRGVETLLKRHEQSIEEAKRRFIALDERQRTLQAAVEQMRARIRTIDRFKSTPFSNALLLEFLARSRPEGVLITRIDADRHSLRVAGHSISHPRIADFMKSLNDSPNFRNSDFLYTRFDEDESRIRFEIETEIVRS
jgi:Tfp pilus assembly PilM family ATPase/Tfp pilus assembly protein PilN